MYDNHLEFKTKIKIVLFFFLQLNSQYIYPNIQIMVFTIQGFCIFVTRE